AARRLAWRHYRPKVGPGGSRAPTRGALPKREDGDVRLAPGGRSARAEQPAVRRDRADRPAATDRRGSGRRRTGGADPPGDPAVGGGGGGTRRATERCERIVRTFLAMARQRHAEPKPMSMNRIIEMAVELLAYQLRSANIRVELDLAEDIPMVPADADQIHQVLTNLIVNARQALSGAATPGRIWIATRFDQRQIEVSVKDNGPGVPEEIRKRIFEPFFTTKPVGEGTGIGLSLCSSIVRAHGGRVDVSDNVGGGAAFTVVLPLGTTSLADPKELAHRAPPAGLRVLIVDDETEITHTLREILRSAGHEADVAENGRQGLERALLTPYDLILSDMRMPVLDGPGLYRALQRQRPEMV